MSDGIILYIVFSEEWQSKDASFLMVACHSSVRALVGYALPC